MNNKTKQQTDYITKWYQTFGIDHVFYDINNVNFEETKPEPFVAKFNTIDELKIAVSKIDCPLKNTAKNTVFSAGNKNASIMIIGEAPGADEDEQGLPFVGQSGQLLNNMLASVNLKRSDVYISNIVFWRPPGNRQPSNSEIALCLPFVEEHIMLVRPKILILLGGVAVKSLLRSTKSITSMRGRKISYNGIPTIPTFHPAYLLRYPSQKSTAFRDFILLKNTLNSQGT